MRKATLVVPVFLGFLALAISPRSSAQAQLVGEWSGSISTPQGNGHLLWHVVKASDGSITSTYDNVDEGVNGIKVKSLTLNGSELSVVIDDVIHPNGQDVSLAGTFAGTLSKDGNEITGKWTQTQPDEEPPMEITFHRDQATPAQATPAPASPQVAGDWHGTLSAGGAELRVVFHFTIGSDGAVTGTLDSVDQGSNGIPINSGTLKGSQLKLAVDAVKGTYDGTLNSEGTQIKGTWSQGMPLELTLERGAFKIAEAKPAAPSDIDGNWQGTLAMGFGNLRIIYQIANTQDGLTAKLQSPDQGGSWTSAYPMTRSGTSVTIPIKAIGSTYEGKLSADLASIDGTFQQGGQSIPLTLKRVKD